MYGLKKKSGVFFLIRFRKIEEPVVNNSRSRSLERSESNDDDDDGVTTLRAALFTKVVLLMTCIYGGA